MKTVFQAFNHFEGLHARGAVANRIATAATMAERFQAIKAFYELALPEIMKAPPGKWGVDPFEVRWNEVFTPIERLTWQVLRAERMVMYPQFPVGPWFVDFGDPVRRVAIECDGEAYHLNVERDEARDADLARRGWWVVRFTGSECAEEMRDPERQDRTSSVRYAVRLIGKKLAAA